MMIAIIFLLIILGIPAIFLILHIKASIAIAKAKKNNETIEKKLLIKYNVFGVIFMLIIIFYISMWYRLSLEIAYHICRGGL